MADRFDIGDIITMKKLIRAGAGVGSASGRS